MSVLVEQNVFGFEVAVDDVEGMEIVEGEGDFCCVEFGDGIGESLEIEQNIRNNSFCESPDCRFNIASPQHTLGHA